MKHSNLALRLDEFAEEILLREESRPATQTQTVAANGTERRAPRRLTFTTRLIQTRDSGLRQFRVF
jgi:hypothetical protein